MTTLEDTIRSLAARGEISHISLTPKGAGWRATFAPCSTFGVAFAEDADPCRAIQLACDAPRLKRRAIEHGV
jgi:hypothetical protein